METEEPTATGPDGTAVRDALFDLLYGALSGGGRREALLGGDIASARHAYANMAPPIDQVHVLFEMPLSGRPGLDLIFGQNCPGGAVAPKGADLVWRRAVEWLSIANPSGDARSDITVMAEADVSAGQSGQTGLYLIYWKHTEAVPSFLDAIGVPGQRKAWEAFVSRLPDGWASTYVGLFPGRAGGLLRVNARPTSEQAKATCASTLESLGVTGASAALEPYADALAKAEGFDCQLDVDEAGTHHGTWGLEVFSIRDATAPGRHRMDPLLMAQMESHGVIDDRWRLLERLGLARSVTVPLAGGPVPCSVCLRFYSAKVKFPEGAHPYGKAYMKADAVAHG